MGLTPLDDGGLLIDFRMVAPGYTSSDENRREGTEGADKEGLEGMEQTRYDQAIPILIADSDRQRPAYHSLSATIHSNEPSESSKLIAPRSERRTSSRSAGGDQGGLADCRRRRPIFLAYAVITQRDTCPVVPFVILLQSSPLVIVRANFAASCPAQYTANTVVNDLSSSVSISVSIFLRQSP